MILNFCFIIANKNLVFQEAFDLLSQQSEYSAHIIYSAWWNVDAETLVTEFMNSFGIREIVLTKLFMTRQTIVSSVTIQIIIISDLLFLIRISESISLNLEKEFLEKFYEKIFLPSQDDPFSSFGCHIALSISDSIPMSINNDLDCFYENIKVGNRVNNEHAIYSFLLSRLSNEENRQFLHKDPKFLKTLKYETKFASLLQSARENNSKWYIYYLCQRQTVNLKPTNEREGLSILKMANGLFL